MKESTPDCDERFYRDASTAQPWFDKPYHLLASSIVYASGDEAEPLSLVKVCTAENFNGNCGVATALYRYDRPTDSFNRVFLNLTGRNNNEETRFVQRGPLEGDVIVVYPTEHAPYTHWVEVCRTSQSGQYIRILRYRGRTGYSDGNPLAVADSEMPEILRQFGCGIPGMRCRFLLTCQKDAALCSCAKAKSGVSDDWVHRPAAN